MQTLASPRAERQYQRSPVAAGAPSNRPLDRVDPELFAEIDERCIQVDRVLAQQTEVLKDAFVLAAAYRDRRLTSALAVALRCADDLTREAGDLGVALVELCDALNAEKAR